MALLGDVMGTGEGSATLTGADALGLTVAVAGPAGALDPAQAARQSIKASGASGCSPMGLSFPRPVAPKLPRWLNAMLWLSCCP